jgi:acyl dehydratase
VSDGGSLYAEDIAVGSETALGEWPISAEEIVAFGRQWDPLPFHTDPARAEELIFGGLVASGAHTMAIFQRLAVDAVWSRFASVIGRQMELRMLQPVFAGDTLTATLRWDDVRPRGDGRALVSFHARLANQQAVLVYEVIGNVVITRRPDAGA